MTACAIATTIHLTTSVVGSFRMGSGKGRRGSGASTITANSPSRQQQYEAEGGWPGRVKVLASSTMGSAARDEGLCVKGVPCAPGSSGGRGGHY